MMFLHSKIKNLIMMSSPSPPNECNEEDASDWLRSLFVEHFNNFNVGVDLETETQFSKHPSGWVNATTSS